MHVFAQKLEVNEAITFPELKPKMFGRAHRGQGREGSARTKEGRADFAVPGTADFDHDLSRIPVYPSSRSGLLKDRAPDAGTGQQIPYPGARYEVPKKANVPKKKAGVDSFRVEWTQNRFFLGPKFAWFRLEYFAKFTKDATHDPAFADFRQNAFHTLEVTDGPHKGLKENNAPMHDDHYSRAQADTASDVNFESNDNPGAGLVNKPLDKDDVINYSFTAEQMIIDTGDGDKVVAKLGPHTATIKGKHPRTFEGVPVTLKTN